MGTPARNLLLVSGTRPEIIKLAPLYHALKTRPDTRVQWLHTGQHGDMAEQILACFDIKPDIKLARRGSTLAEFSIGCRAQLEQVMQEPWSLAVVQGDTESAFLGALTAFYHHVPVAHVEAGLRTYNPARPFPEEILRQMIGRIARFHFPPTERARAALLKENIADKLITLTGNTVVDAQNWVITHRGIGRKIEGRGHLLVTTHRRENWGHDINEVCYALATIAERHPELQILFPVHLNPVVQQPVHAILGHVPNVKLINPLDYLEMQQALADAWLVLTDSGGLQEEAPTFGVPLLVLREETERPEALEAGCAQLVGTQRAKVVDTVEALWQNQDAWQAMARAGNPFGDGKACERIIATLERDLA
ncbi:UDP-N-acetylglucosamine 2-epimerase (non-hydrolyzing) [Silvimonas terrae]|uniref:UDP-N-acetylglucosamine 2-epimerase (non-hydrolyzing) n=1 Tax=Silvimonas terrae TaxID=300266 RepID=A0A840RIT5_9NEIS|nr:UDP-N-acetylglucosamine 2-epimerase (non-hydrolyzing) [Silvimonas terrae]MBB5192152.1 UDP-N-acetylglucosamine 2-epimerase (non-hydrolyzing) [Silvimonas terrae]